MKRYYALAPILLTIIAPMHTRDLEPDAQTACTLARAYIPHNPIIIEAGAHHGEDTILLKGLWPHATIYAFEPHPESYKKLIQNTHGIHKIYPYWLALNAQTGSALFYCCRLHDGASSLLESSPERKDFYNDKKAIIVPCTTLDDWAAAHSINYIDFCWLDMEGAELLMLTNSPQMLATIKAIYIEVNFQEFRKTMAQYAAVKEFLNQQGFELIFITPHSSYDVQANALFVRKVIATIQPPLPLHPEDLYDQ